MASVPETPDIIELTLTPHGFHHTPRLLCLFLSVREFFFLFLFICLFFSLAVHVLLIVRNFSLLAVLLITAMRTERDALLYRSLLSSQLICRRKAIFRFYHAALTICTDVRGLPYTRSMKN